MFNHAVTERVEQRRSAREERGADDVPMDPENVEQVSDRHAVAFGEDDRQHDENRMIDIHIGNGGPETAHEEQPDKLKNTVRFEQETPHSASFCTVHVSLDILRVVTGKTEGPVLVQKSGHVDDDMHISALDVFHEMDGRKRRYIKEGIEEKMLEISA